MSEKKDVMFAVRITISSYRADMENSEKIKTESYEKFTDNLTGALLSFTIQKETVENLGCVENLSTRVADIMFHRLAEIHGELSSSWPVDIDNRTLSSLIYQGAVNGVMNYMRQWRQSKTDWSMILDTQPNLELSGASRSLY